MTSAPYREASSGASMSGMDTSPLPHDLDPRDLAHLCDQRAHELHVRAWRTDAERDALREATADLLSAVARQLDGGAPAADGPVLSEDELRTLIATHVVHQPLRPVHEPADDHPRPPAA